MSQPASTRLDALTSLRFFAAMMIVLLHTYGAFGIAPSRYNMQQGVSFFYVLSGFILTLVYPRLEGWAAVRKFMRARFARVWPAYMFALLASVVLIGYAFRPLPLLAYVAMVQSWIPLPAYFNSYNSVGWSVATEWFFYLAFPLLIINFERTWKWKLALSLLLVVAMAAICSAVPMSESAKVWELQEKFQLNKSGMMYFNPVARLFEFVLGMCVALAWRRRDATRSFSPVWGTALELVAVGVCAASMLVSMLTLFWVREKFGFAMGRWYFGSGSAPAFALLIYVVALGRGYVSRALAWRPLVLGGEISFSIYLLHGILHTTYASRQPELPTSPDWLAFFGFIGVVWLSSYVAWRFVEMPVRRLIVGGQVHGSSVVTDKAPPPRLATRLRPALAIVALVAVGVAFSASTVGPAKVARVADGEAVARTLAPGSCNLEYADTQKFVRGEPMGVATSMVMLSGWFLSRPSGRPGLPANMRMVPDAGGPSYEAPIDSWGPRKDVLEALQAVGEGNPGFRQRFDVSPLDVGSYRLHLIWQDNGRDYDCDTGQQLVIGVLS
jgi:peptidoglycan/LPS O-acetylase OafA/YrhL